MRVVVHDGHPARLAHALEPPRHAGKAFERRDAALEIDSQLQCHGECRRGVSQVVQPRHLQREAHRPPPAVRQLDPRRRAALAQLGTHDPHVRVGREPHAPYRRLERRGDPHRPRVVRAGDHPARPPRELCERLLERRQAAAVTLEVVRLDVVHHRDRRREREERTIVLVRLDDVQLVPAEPRVPTPPSDTAAGESRRISPGGRQRLRDHHRRGGLAVRAGDRHHQPTGDGLT